LIWETERGENQNKITYYLAAVCLIGYAKGKWLTKSITVRINLFPNTVQGVKGPTIWLQTY